MLSNTFKLNFEISLIFTWSKTVDGYKSIKGEKCVILNVPFTSITSSSQKVGENFEKNSKKVDVNEGESVRQ